MGPKILIAIDNLGHLPMLFVTPGDKQDRTQLKRTANAGPRASGKNLEFVLAIHAIPASRPRAVPMTTPLRFSSSNRRRPRTTLPAAQAAGVLAQLHMDGAL